MLLLENIEQKLEIVVKTRKIPPWADFLMGKIALKKARCLRADFAFICYKVLLPKVFSSSDEMLKAGRAGSFPL